MEFLKTKHFVALSNPGVESLQLISPLNSASSRVTITRVTVSPGAMQPLHSHETSEQVWVVLSGQGTLLLHGDSGAPFSSGDVVRFAEGDVHGFENTSTQPFVYISITSPPIDFAGSYTSETY